MMFFMLVYDLTLTSACPGIIDHGNYYVPGKQAGIALFESLSDYFGSFRRDESKNISKFLFIVRVYGVYPDI